MSLFLLEGINVRGALLRGTRMVAEMRANHDLGPLETLVLGHAYLAAGLLSASLKGRDRLSLRVECSGPFQGFSAETNALGDVRGYLLKNPIELAADFTDEATLASLWGGGDLSLTRFPEGAKSPFTGRVRLERGSLAVNLTRYFLRSEQTKTAFYLSTHFDREGRLLGAGGLFLQALPGADEKVLEEMEERLQDLPPPGKAFAAGTEVSAYLLKNFSRFFPKELESRRVDFSCPCAAERFSGFIGALPEADLRDLAENGPFPVKVTCHNCSSTYEFSKGELEALLAKRKT